MWQHDHRDRIAGYIKYQEATGEQADEMATAPKIDQHTAGIWDAWNYLTASRSYTMGGAASIAISEILAYCRFRRINDDDDRDRLLCLISRMDGEYLNLQHKKEGA